MKVSQLLAKGLDNCEPRPFTHVETAFADGGNTTKFMKVFCEGFWLYGIQ